jgi:3-isopropylmalate/(R)-2-methylmalate dehydratase large subunit
MAGATMSEKILARAAGVESCHAGDILWVDVDKAMMDDILGPRVEIAEGLRQFGDRVWDTTKTVVISDHYTPPGNIRQAEIVSFTRAWSVAHGIDHYYEFAGPCHQLMAEFGHVLPGRVVVGTDSHTCMGGALGAFATGIGSTEMLGVLATGQTWLRVPQTIRVRWSGSLPEGVMAKDIALYTIGAIGHAGATYKAVEFCGDAIDAMAVDQRMAITNMAVEMGAKAGLMAPDEKVMAYLAEHGIQGPFAPLFGDNDATFCRSECCSATDLVPMVACPHQVDNVHPVEEVGGVAIDQAYLGSCTGGRTGDLEAAARILRGRTVAPGVRLLVSPASQSIWLAAARSGLLATLAEAGAVVLAPTCGVCVGLHSGIIAAGETCISASNRNFIGRMGSKDANIYLGSPMTVAASAIAGRLTSATMFL